MKHYILIFLACLLQTTTAFSPTTFDLPADQAQDFEEAAEVYLSSFQKYLGEIADAAKAKDEMKIKKLFAHVKDLFVDSNQTIEVGWIANNRLDKKPFTVLAYLERLRYRSEKVYTNVDIGGYKKASVDVPFALIDKSNETYKASYNYHQLFHGYDANRKLMYGDSTIKKVEVFAYKKRKEVKLGKITVDKIFLIKEVKKGGFEAKSQQQQTATRKGAYTNRYVLKKIVEESGASIVQLQGRNGFVTRTLEAESFQERCKYDEFLRYNYKETIQENSQKIVILQLQ